jgi:fumarate hydratase, class I
MISADDVVALYRKVATQLPEDVLAALEKAHAAEETPSAKETMRQMLLNAKKAKELSRPMCQDTGTPFFYVTRPAGTSETALREVVCRATETATKDVPLRPNAIDTLTDRSMGNVPVIHFEEGNRLAVRLLLKGGGSENVSAVYKLPDERLSAQRDMDGVRRCVLDAVFRAQGKGCPPYFIGVAAAGSIEEAARLSKMQLLRDAGDVNNAESLRKLEKRLLSEVNGLGIGPMGLGGNTTALSVKIAAGTRHPATYFVGVSFGCWCMRRGEL